MSWTTWFAKRIYKYIQQLKLRRVKFQYYVNRVDEAIAMEERKLRKFTNKMSYDEYLKFSLDTGLIADDDYYAILKIREENEKNDR